MEAVGEMYTAEGEERLLGGSPDFVLDAIDNIETKVGQCRQCSCLGVGVGFCLPGAAGTVGLLLALFATSFCCSTHQDFSPAPPLPAPLSTAGGAAGGLPPARHPGAVLRRGGGQGRPHPPAGAGCGGVGGRPAGACGAAQVRCGAERRVQEQGQGAGAGAGC